MIGPGCRYAGGVVQVSALLAISLYFFSRKARLSGARE